MFKKQTLLIIATFGIISLSGCQTEPSNLYGYDFDNAQITYSISGSSTGNSEVIIAGNNKFIHNQITQTLANGETKEIDTTFIQKGKDLYNLDNKTKTGNKITSPIYQELKDLSPEDRKLRLLSDATRSNLSWEEFKENTPAANGTESVAGQTCNLYGQADFETCLWQSIPLKTHASLPDYGIETNTIATNIELNTELSGHEFEVPQDYQITELN